MIRKILVSLDGSEHANKALDYALDLAKKYSAEIVLLSVIPPVVIPVAYPDAKMAYISPSTMGMYYDELKTSHESLLSQALRKAMGIGPDLRVSTKIAEGRPSEKIIEAAKEGGFDLIVMGSRGLGGAKEFFLGSVSHRVAIEAPCPVLIVK